VIKTRAISDLLQSNTFVYQHNERTFVTTRIASWDARVKGIDDTAVRNLPITSISIHRWLNRLSPRFRRIATARLTECEAFGAL
jgi:hypothetical protein